MKFAIAIAALFVVSCSTVSVTRTPSGGLHAGVTSFGGKQAVQDATINTREGDVIRIAGYSTQNPDPETTRLIRDGALWNAGLTIAGEVLETGIEEGVKLAQ